MKNLFKTLSVINSLELKILFADICYSYKKNLLTILKIDYFIKSLIKYSLLIFLMRKKVLLIWLLFI